MLRTLTFKTTVQDAGNNAAMAAPTAATNGTLLDLDDSFSAHLLASKANVADFTVWGMDQTNAWYDIGDVSFATTHNEAQRMEGATGYKRVYA